MKIAVQGCAHGELDNIYETIKYLEEKEGFKIDLLICCGDFQASRNEEDLRCMAVPAKYYNICSFYKYYNGEKKAPILTIFIGGNHEASNYLQELPYGGWVAPNIFYMGYAGVVNVAGLRIGGISGIYKSNDYMRGHHEIPPYTDSSKRSVYHVRNLEVFRLKQLNDSLDIFISHDWPTGICNYGNKQQLIRFKPHFSDDIESGKLGSEPLEELLHELKPTYWFAAHLHCKFAALVPHSNGSNTKFLALDKCLPKRRFLQILDIPHEKTIELNYDLEWLTILHSTDHLLSVKSVYNYMPSATGNERYSFKPTEEEKELMLSKMDDNLVIPHNFKKTANGFVGRSNKVEIKQPGVKLNPQTIDFCKKVDVRDSICVILEMDGTLNDVLEKSVDDVYECSTFIDTDNEVSLSLSRTSLVLPAPVNAIDEPAIIDNAAIETESKIEEVEENSEGSKDLQAVKTFKRRNHEIYMN